MLWARLAARVLLLKAVFDIYFTSPIVDGVDRVEPAPWLARRVVLVVIDGLRADVLDIVAPDSRFCRQHRPVVPFFDFLAARGVRGISHTRVPTESRPGHVALMAGIYEDVSAVTRGWKANPVPFDTVANASRHVLALGSPDIIPMFARDLPHARFETYSADLQDFSGNTTVLDEWVLHRLQHLLGDEQVHAEISGPGAFVLLHLLAVDTVGHAARPCSSAYRAAVEHAAEVARQAYDLFNSAFPDNSTAFVLTSDHGMSHRGSHGGGDESETRTPLLAVGPGLAHQDALVSVNQGDLAPLLAVLLGTAPPVHSTGILPHAMLDLSEREIARRLVVNAQQMLALFRRKETLRRERDFLFSAYVPDSHPGHTVDMICQRAQNLFSIARHRHAINEAKECMHACLAGMQCYDRAHRPRLTAVVVLGYFGFMLLSSGNKKAQSATFRHGAIATTLCGIALAWLLLAQQSPWSYYLHYGFALVVWARLILFHDLSHILKVIATHVKALTVSLVTLSLLAISFSFRPAAPLALIAASLPHWPLIRTVFLPTAVLAALTLLPPGLDWRLTLPGLASWLVILALVFSSIVPFTSISYSPSPTLSSPPSFLPPLVIISTTMVVAFLSDTLILADQSQSLALATMCFILSLAPLFLLRYQQHNPHPADTTPASPPSNVQRLKANSSIDRAATRTRWLTLALLPAMLLLSVSFEAVAYCIICIAIDCIITALKRTQSLSSSSSTWPHDVTLALAVLAGTFTAFFALGNVSSISSFDVISVLRFGTVFAPAAMATLIVVKICIPIFAVLLHAARMPNENWFTFACLGCDALSLFFLFQVRDEGSWKDIGLSIASVAIVSLLHLLLLLFHHFSLWCLAAPAPRPHTL
eukprot:m.103539 g.103539  ORF g.103539 m.103539 type:complete len:875 (+) comp14151_c0_seq3:25-2649(+)